MKNLLNEIRYRLIYALAYLVSLLPYSVLYALSTFSCIFVYNIFGYRKTVVIQNISRSFPEKKYQEIKNISKDFYKKFVDHFVEILKTISISPKDLNKRIEFINFDIVKDYLSQNKSVIAALGHCGNWEMFNILPFAEKINVYALYKPLRNKTQDRLMYSLRTRFGVKMVPSKKAARHILSKETKPGIYLFIGDQCPWNVDETYRMEFLHQSTAMFPGIERLSKVGDLPVVYLNITNPKRGFYRIECQLLTENSKTSGTTEVTRRYAGLLEANIRQEPSGWLWTHKRWKR